MRDDGQRVTQISHFFSSPPALGPSRGRAHSHPYSLNAGGLGTGSGITASG